jgi:hypothetical protein
VHAPQGAALQRDPHRAPASRASGALAWWGRLGVAVEQGAHFGALVERFSEGEGNSDGDDVPLAELARIRKGKAIACDDDDDDDDKDEIDDIGESNRELKRQAGPSTDAQAHDPAAPHWSPHRTMYTPFVYAPDLIAPAHPFGIYAPGTMPDPLSFSTLPDHAADATTDNEEADYDEDEEDLMLPRRTRRRSKPSCARSAARRGRCAPGGDIRGCLAAQAPGRRTRRWRCERRSFTESAGAEMDRDGAHSMCLRKRRKDAFEGGGYVPVPVAAFEEPDGVR